MYGLGGDEPVHPVLSAISGVFGALAGLAFGLVAFLLATVFPAMLHRALPAMPMWVFLVLWSVAMLVPLSAFSHVLRNGRGWGTRAFAICGIAVLTLLFAGELTGTISVYPWKTGFYVVPGPYDPSVKR